MLNKKICVIGLGYIGLPTAALLASKGHSVFGIDLNTDVVNTINQGDIHIVEPGLDAYVRSAVASGKLMAFDKPQLADIYIICVPTPFHEVGQIPQPNIDYVLAAAESIAPLVKMGDIVILESTSPVGTTKKVSELLQKLGVNTDGVHIAYCPERVLPGKIMTELVENDRVVGGICPDATKAVSNFYRSFVSGEVLETDSSTAEMCKLTENSFRDVNIAFANELSILSANAGIDVWELIRLANHHPRVNILQPGTGVGGHCIAVDPWFIVASDPITAKLIRLAREVNTSKTLWVIDQISGALDELSGTLKRKPKIACLGLAFKANVDDLRESPAVQIVLALESKGFDVFAVEPNILEDRRFNLISIKDAVDNADVIALLVGHKEFIDASTLGMFSGKVILDYCGVLI
jgi:UDP-N-acetyl-D-mannosaminuronic acid dehydrogenase